jgi:hypothetical protein
MHYKVFGIRDGGAEKHVATVYSAAEGKTTHHGMKVAGYFDTMIVRDVKDYIVMRKDLVSGFVGNPINNEVDANG